MRRLGTVPKLTFVITNRFVSVPHVRDEERLLIEPLTVPGFYHVVARYGYMEKIVQDKPFVTSIVTQLRALLSDALHGLSATDHPPAKSPPNATSLPATTTIQQLTAAVDELNAAPLFAGRSSDSTHADNGGDKTHPGVDSAAFLPPGGAAMTELSMTGAAYPAYPVTMPRPHRSAPLGEVPSAAPPLFSSQARSSLQTMGGLPARVVLGHASLPVSTPIVPSALLWLCVLKGVVL